MTDTVPPNEVPPNLLAAVIERGDEFGDLANATADDLRDALALAAAEIRTLREVLVFADGFVVSQTMNSEHPMVLADLYNTTCPAASVIVRAGCHPRGRFRDDHACCKRHVPGPVFTTFAGDPPPEFICPECGARWLWDDDEAEGGAWYWDPENDRAGQDGD
jgi:hypothetical protein